MNYSTLANNVSVKYLRSLLTRIMRTGSPIFSDMKENGITEEKKEAFFNCALDALNLQKSIMRIYKYRYHDVMFDVHAYASCIGLRLKALGITRESDGEIYDRARDVCKESWHILHGETQDIPYDFSYED